MKIFPTRFPRYSVDDTGQVYRDGTPLKAHPRGNSTKNGTRYLAVNISIYDDNGKFTKQIKYYVHRLVAEAFIDNPENLPDVDHIDCNKENNHVDNLRWSSREDNMARNALPEGTIRVHNRDYQPGRNPTRYIKKDGEWVLIPSERPPWNKGKKGVSWNTGMKFGAPDGTVTGPHKNGGYKIKENGKWRHLRLHEYDEHGITK